MFVGGVQNEEKVIDIMTTIFIDVTVSISNQCSWNNVEDIVDNFIQPNVNTNSVSFAQISYFDFCINSGCILGSIAECGDKG